MADELASVTELQLRLDWTLDQGEQSMAEAALADLSDDARFYGSARWNSDTAPRQVKSVVLRAAARFMRNPDGYTQSRAGDETIMWNDSAGQDAGTAFFTEREQKILASLAGRGNGLVSVQVIAHGPLRRRGPRYINPMTQDLSRSGEVGYVPTEGAPIPFFNGDDLPGEY
jgi:hypothetical protein